MSFAHPAVLLLLALPVMLAYWIWVRRGRPLVMPFDHARTGDAAGLRRLVSVVDTLPAALLALAVVVLAGPRRPAPPADERILNNILFCLDVSGSMGSGIGIDAPEVLGRTRYDAAMKAIQDFCDYRKGDAFGLTIFGSEYLHWIPPTRELTVIKLATPFLRPGRLPPWFGGTMIAQALEGCRARLASIPTGDRAIILVTDGASADFDGSREVEVARALAQERIRVYSILIGNDSLPGIDIVTSMTGGRAFQAGDPQALAYVFSEIDRMQKAQFRRGAPGWVSWYRPFAFFGLALLGVYVTAQAGLRFTPW